MRTEIHRLNHYHKTDFRLSYLRTKDQAEIDLIIERLGRGAILIKIKSGDRPDPIEARKLEAFLSDFPGATAYLLCLAEHPQQMGQVLCLPWQEGLERIFA